MRKANLSPAVNPDFKTPASLRRFVNPALGPTAGGLYETNLGLGDFPITFQNRISHGLVMALSNVSDCT
jgi:hypothetical protein